MSEGTFVAFHQRDRQTDWDAQRDAESGCVLCKLCGGHAIISDAGPGYGYYIRCSNSGAFRRSKGCMITDVRLGGWAYNVRDWWNRLHGPRDSDEHPHREDAERLSGEAMPARAEGIAHNASDSTP